MSRDCPAPHRPRSPLSRFERVVSAMGGKVTTPYGAGYDCGLNGANTDNCHFSLFSNPQRTKEWERGKADGERAKATA